MKQRKINWHKLWLEFNRRTKETMPLWRRQRDIIKEIAERQLRAERGVKK